MISFTCPSCSHKLQVQNDMAGKKAKCPKCGQIVLCPSAAVSVGSSARSESQARAQPAELAPADQASFNTRPPDAFPETLPPPTVQSATQEIAWSPH